jgi:hypothetical protein
MFCNTINQHDQNQHRPTTNQQQSTVKSTCIFDYQHLSTSKSTTTAVNQQAINNSLVNIKNVIRRLNQS